MKIGLEDVIVFIALSTIVLSIVIQLAGCATERGKLDISNLGPKQIQILDNAVKLPAHVDVATARGLVIEKGIK